VFDSANNSVCNSSKASCTFVTVIPQIGFTTISVAEILTQDIDHQVMFTLFDVKLFVTISLKFQVVASITHAVRFHKTTRSHCIVINGAFSTQLITSSQSIAEAVTNSFPSIHISNAFHGSCDIKDKNFTFAEKSHHVNTMSIVSESIGIKPHPDHNNAESIKTGLVQPLKVSTDSTYLLSSIRHSISLFSIGSHIK
jgi:hypothetical protein